MYLKDKLAVDIMLDELFVDDLSTLVISSTPQSKELTDYLCRRLKFYDIPFMGSYFTAVSADSKIYDSGIVVTEIKTPHRNYIVQDVSAENLEQRLERIIPKNSQHTTYFAWVSSSHPVVDSFLKTLNKKINSYCSQLSDHFNTTDMKSLPCVFNNSGSYENAAIVIFLNQEWNTHFETHWRF